ncbi:MAG: signal peptidase I [Candidatus Nomurabacteria bacterium]|jgi:signal peptidase I|nr:signal peptidase I [Candidatus Nomurabacteria bacterium]
MDNQKITSKIPKFWQRHPFAKDLVSLLTFIIGVILVTYALTAFVFRSYNVVGGSMENTLQPDDRVLVNRVPVSLAHLFNKNYTPNRGQVIVFINPNYRPGDQDQYIIKRTIAFSGERVVVKDGILTVYNNEHPDGFRPDDGFHGEPKAYTSGDVDEIIPEGAIFVSGDNRDGNHSFDSRNGLGLIPLYDIVGPVGLRVFPLDKVRFF